MQNLFNIYLNNQITFENILKKYCEKKSFFKTYEPKKFNIIITININKLSKNSNFHSMISLKNETIYKPNKLGDILNRIKNVTKTKVKFKFYFS